GRLPPPRALERGRAPDRDLPRQPARADGGGRGRRVPVRRGRADPHRELAQVHRRGLRRGGRRGGLHAPPRLDRPAPVVRRPLLRGRRGLTGAVGGWYLEPFPSRTAARMAKKKTPKVV